MRWNFSKALIGISLISACAFGQKSEKISTDKLDSYLKSMIELMKPFGRGDTAWMRIDRDTTIFYAGGVEKGRLNAKGWGFGTAPTDSSITALGGKFRALHVSGDIFVTWAGKVRIQGTDALIVDYSIDIGKSADEAGYIYLRNEYNDYIMHFLAPYTAGSHKIIELPNCNGTVITTGNLDSITAVGSLILPISKGGTNSTSYTTLEFLMWNQATNKIVSSGYKGADFADINHNHSGVYEPAFSTLGISKGGTNNTSYTALEFLTWSSGTNKIVSSGYRGADFADINHNHSGVYLPIGGTAANSDQLDGYHAASFALVGHNHAGVYHGYVSPAFSGSFRDADGNWYAVVNGIISYSD